MLGDANQAFIDADLAYHRERLMADFHRANHRTRTGVGRKLIDAVRRTQGRGGFRRDPRAVAAPHHATSVC
jgi:hypothetical protein